MYFPTFEGLRREWPQPPRPITWPERVLAFVQGRIEALAAWHLRAAIRHVNRAHACDAISKWLARLWPHVEDIA